MTQVSTYLGDPEKLLARQPTSRPDVPGFDVTADRYWTSLAPSLGDPQVVFVIVPFNQNYDAISHRHPDWEIAPGILLARGPKPPSTLSFAAPPVRPSTRDLVEETLLGVLLLTICGIGWSFDLMTVKRQTDKGFPEYDSGDTFVSAGEELVPLNNAEQDWRCENEHSFQRFRRIDSDGDGLNNWQEWRAGTDAMNPSSFLKLQPPYFYSGIVSIAWESADGVTYFVQRSTNLGGQPAFVTVQSNIVSQGNYTFYSEVPVGTGPVFYRVAVQ
jgi:hypothetical protein